MKKIQELVKEFTPQAEITEDYVERFRCAMLGNCDTFSIRERPLWKTWGQQKNRLLGLYVVGIYKINFEKLHQFNKSVQVITGVRTNPSKKRIDQLLVSEFPICLFNFFSSNLLYDHQPGLPLAYRHNKLLIQQT